MKAYRIYNQDTENNMTDFNDLRYIVLEETQGTALVLNTTTGQYTVAIGIQYEKLDSIHWAQGKYFDDHSAAYDCYRKLTDEVYSYMTETDLDYSTLETILRYVSPEISITLGLLGALKESTKLQVEAEKELATMDCEPDEPFTFVDEDPEDVFLGALIEGATYRDPEEPEEIPELSQEEIEGLPDIEELFYKTEDIEWVLDREITEVELVAIRTHFPVFYRDPRGNSYDLKLIDTILNYLDSLVTK